MTGKKMAVCYDSQSCIKCFACVTNCAVENRVRLQNDLNISVERTMTESLPHYNYLTVKHSEKGIFPNVLSVTALEHCRHCQYPKCMEICPAEAISKRDTGAVVIDKNKCVGCQSCVDACPYDIPVFDKESGKPYKCVMCSDRLEDGLPTACAAACPSVAIFCGTVEDVKNEAIKRAAHYEEVFGKKFIVYGAHKVNNQVGELSYMTIAPEENREEYIMPEDPVSGVSVARDVIKVAGLVGIGATAAAVAIHTAHWKKNKSGSVYDHKDEE